MLFRNTSAPSNPFASESSLISSVYSKGYKKPAERHITNTYNQTKGTAAKLRYENDYWSSKQQTNINDIKQDNPFEKYTNLQDLVRQGITEKHQYERSKKRSLSPFKTNYQSGNYRAQSSKYLDTYNGNSYSEYGQPSSTSYIPSSYTPKNYDSNGYNQYGGSYYASSSYIPINSQYAPLVPEQPVPYQPIQTTTPLQKKPSKFKPITGNPNQSSHYSFDQDQRRSKAESISQYFPKQQQRNLQPLESFQPYQPYQPPQPLKGSQASQAIRGSQASQAFKQPLQSSQAYQVPQGMQQSQVSRVSGSDPFQSQVQKKDSIMSYTSQKSQKQSSFKNSLSKKVSIRSNNNLRFSSADQRQTFGPSRLQPKNSTSDDPFDQFNMNNQNYAYQSFVQQKSPWPQFIQLNNIKFYYKPLKSKPRNKST